MHNILSTQLIRQDILQSPDGGKLLDGPFRDTIFDSIGMKAPTGLIRAINPDRVEVRAVVPVVNTGV